MTTQSYDYVDYATRTREWAAALERHGLVLAVALAYALRGDTEAAHRISADVRVMGRPVSELSDAELAYLEEVTTR